MEDKKTILITDDTELNRMGYRDAFRELYHVIEAKNGKEAVQIMTAVPVDLLLLDLVMPVMDGVEVLKYRQGRPEIQKIPVIVVTAMDRVETEIQLFDLGADDVICRPFDFRVLQRRLENVLKNRSFGVILEENEAARRLQLLKNQLTDMFWQQQERKKMFYVLLDSVPSGVVIYRLSEFGSKAVFSNRAACKLFGYQYDEYLDMISKDAFCGVHPEDKDNIYKELRRACEERSEFKLSFRHLKKEGGYQWVTLHMSLEIGSDHVMGYGSFTDIGMLKERAERDSLTGLYNRGTFREMVTQELERCGKKRLILFFIDLDNFKPINDNFGHDCGDEVLKEASKRIQNVFREGDIVARVGGDEFCVFITSALSEEIVNFRAGMLVKKLEIEVSQAGKTIKTSASIGIAYSDNYDMDYDRLYKAADEAQYYAKKRRKNCYCVAGEKNTLYVVNERGRIEKQEE